MFSDYTFLDNSSGAFFSCFNLTSVSIPDSITSIGEYAFFWCRSLTNVTIPNSVISIGGGAFSMCLNLTNINVANGNPAYIFVDGVLFSADLTLLHTYPAGKIGTSYCIPASVTVIGDGAFERCSNLTNITFPDGVTSIGEWAFSDCDNLTSVTIPDSVISIGRGAFSTCDNLTNITIPDGVTFIGKEAFSDCGNLTSVTIPDSVTTIGELAFDGCNNLADVYYGGSESQWEQIQIDRYHWFGGNRDGSVNELLRLLNATIHYNSAAPVTSSGISVTVNGVAVQWTDVAPFIDENDRTMVPLRAVADAMKLKVNWDAAAREAFFTGRGKTIYFPIDSTNARTSSGGTVKMDTAAVIVNDRTYAPIRYLAEYFGYTVGWDATTRTVTITG